MKVNFTLFGAKLTGGTFNLIEPAQRLAERGYDVTVTTIGSKKDLEWFRMSKKPAFKEIYTSVADNFFYKVYRRLLNKTILHPFPEVEIRDLVNNMPDCDINIATSAPAAFAVFRSLKGKGLNYIQHYDPLFVKDQSANRFFNESCFLPLEKIAVSSWIKNEIEEKLKIGVESVIPAGIDEKVFYPRKKEKRDKKRIISLGRKVEWKGFRGLEIAIGNLMKKRDDFEWVVFSSRDTPGMNPKVPFKLIKSPYGRELAELYSSADILVNPSWHEGFSQPALEAMASGTAVITTTIGAEDFIKNEKNCLVIDPKNPDQIESAIENLLDNDNVKSQLIDGGLKTAKSFNWDKVIDKWESVINK